MGTLLQLQNVAKRVLSYHYRTFFTIKGSLKLNKELYASYIEPFFSRCVFYKLGERSSTICKISTLIVNIGLMSILCVCNRTSTGSVRKRIYLSFSL